MTNRRPRHVPRPDQPGSLADVLHGERDWLPLLKLQTRVKAWISKQIAGLRHARIRCACAEKSKPLPFKGNKIAIVFWIWTRLTGWSAVADHDG